MGRWSEEDGTVKLDQLESFAITPKVFTVAELMLVCRYHADLLDIISSILPCKTHIIGSGERNPISGHIKRRGA